jgi:hypothetical protein
MFIFRPKGQGKSERQERLLADAPPQEAVKRVAPCHIFNPPPRHLVLHGRLRLPPGSVGRLRLPEGSAGTSSGGPHRSAPAEFLLQLQPKQAMQPALRIGIEPGVFYLLPATEPESPLLRASLPTSSQTPRAQSDLPASLLPNTPLVELREHVIAMPQMPGESQTWSDTSSDATLSSSVISFFTACSDPSSGPNTRDNTIDFSRGSTTDLGSYSSGSAASTIELGAGGATAAHAGHLADRLAVLTVAGGGADLEGGGGGGGGGDGAHSPGAGARCAGYTTGPVARRRGARLLCDVRPGDTSQFVMSDDPRNEYGVPRELGAVLIRGAQLRVIIPRVHSDRTVAQFPVSDPADSLLARYQQGEDLAHMCILDGSLDGPVGVTLKNIESGLLVLQVRREADGPDASTAYAIQYRAPLSAYQALCVSLSLAAIAGSRTES